MSSQKSAATPIRIVLADDHAVLRAGLTALLNAETDMTVVGEAGNGTDCLAVVAEAQPDVILLDLNMPEISGLAVLPELHKIAPTSRVLVLTMHDDESYLRQVLATGGAGYVLKQAADSELLTAIRTVYHGGTFLHPAHTQVLLQPAQPTAGAESPSDQAVALLSDRELEVLKLLALGHSNKEIAEMLYLSVKTVETYKARVMEKLELQTRAALVRFALKHDLLREEE
ncbi:MAG: response regulator transcription factor [Caldilineaceae bacterium]|nr:response regulator transcription factor [Caldilineaceae bacterium]